MKWPTKRKLRIAIALLCTLTLMLCSNSAFADGEEKEELENAASSLHSQLDAINQDMLAISNEISANEMQIEIINGEILRTEESIEQAVLAEDEQYKKMSARIKYIYETGNASMLEMLFTSKSLSDFLNAADFIQLFNSCDQEMLSDLRAAHDALLAQQDTLKLQQESLQELHDGLNRKYNALLDEARATSTDLFVYTMQLEQLRAQEASSMGGENNPPNQDGTDGQPLPDETPGASDSSVSNNGQNSSVSSGDLDLFAAILECEAYQDYESLLAVATVIMNRVESPRFDNTIRGVIYASGQFEPVWTGRLNTVLSRKPTALSYQVAQDAINGARHPAVANCYYFLYAGSTNRPGINIGNNLFFRSW